MVQPRSSWHHPCGWSCLQTPVSPQMPQPRQAPRRRPRPAAPSGTQPWTRRQGAGRRWPIAAVHRAAPRPAMHSAAAATCWLEHAKQPNLDRLLTLIHVRVQGRQQARTRAPCRSQAGPGPPPALGPPAACLHRHRKDHPVPLVRARSTAPVSRGTALSSTMTHPSPLPAARPRSRMRTGTLPTRWRLASSCGGSLRSMLLSLGRASFLW